MKVRIVVPRRADGGHRDRLWAYCEAYWRKELPEADIVEGHHERGPFNRAAAINRGMDGAWDVAVILDGDVIVDADQLRGGIERAAATGHLVLPFRERLSVSEDGTAQILGGYEGTWRRWVTEKQTYNVSTCLCVPRDLWDSVGGFDERFEGWGGEDDAFFWACHALAGADKLPGAAWHLWHPISPWRDWRSPLYVQAKALADRYVLSAKRDRGRAMRALLAEDRGPDQVVIVVLTNGRRPRLLADALESIDTQVAGPIGRKVIVADKCHLPARDGWDIVQVDGGRYWRAMRNAQKVAVGSGQPWVFWMEDDFTIDRPLDLRDLQRVMLDRPRIAQVSLMRQPWYDHEKEAGGVLAAVAARGHQLRTVAGAVEHEAYWTQNPMLTRRDVLALEEWPSGSDSEQAFGRAIFERHSLSVAVYDRGAQWVTHHGVQRASGLGH